MPIISLDIPQYLVDEINYNLRIINHRHPQSPPLSANDITKEALAIYKWVVDSTQQGYAVVTVNVNKELISQISTPHIPAKVPTK